MNERHYETKSGTYISWSAMRRRCLNPDHKAYASYGGRGILVCERWNSYLAFKEDMGARLPGMTIDRIDPNGNYEPSNCRWATRLEQVNNRRNTRKFKIDGEAFTIRQISELFKVKFSLLTKRLNLGWSIERAIAVPSRKQLAISKSKILSGKELRDLSLRVLLASKYPDRAEELLF